MQLRFFIIGFIVSARLLAGPVVFDAPVIRAADPNDPRSNIKDGLVRSKVSDPRLLQDNIAELSGQGRKEKTVGSMSKGGAGIAAAISSGIALTAAAAPLLASPLITDQIRGADLLSKASLEFGQAGATGAATDKNRTGNDTLGPANDGPRGSSIADRIQEQLRETLRNNPALKEALEGNGVGTDAFIDKLAHGDLGSPHLVLSSMGTDSSSLGNIEQEFGRDSAGTPETAHVFIDSSQKEEAPETPDSRSLAFSSEATTSRDVAAVTAKEDNNETALRQQAERLAKESWEKRSKVGATEDTNLEHLTAQYLAFLKKQAPSPDSPVDALDYFQLDSLGVKRLKKKQNMFHVAKRSYRDFGEWRRNQLKRPRRMAQVSP